MQEEVRVDLRERLQQVLKLWMQYGTISPRNDSTNVGFQVGLNRYV
jgi:hypothetical protein